MSKRYYLAPVIGSGNRADPRPWTATTGPYRAKVADYTGGYTAVIPTDNDPASPNYGKPVFPWALCLADVPDHTPLINDAALEALADVALDIKVSAVGNAARKRLSDALTRFGISTAIVTNADAYRDVIRGIGQALDGNFNENNFDVRNG